MRTEIKTLLGLWQSHHRESAQVKKLALRHVGELDAKIAEMQEMRRTLLDLAQHCHGDHRPDCPILEDLAGVGPTPAAAAARSSPRTRS